MIPYALHGRCGPAVVTFHIHTIQRHRTFQQRMNGHERTERYPCCLQLDTKCEKKSYSNHMWFSQRCHVFSLRVETELKCETKFQDFQAQYCRSENWNFVTRKCLVCRYVQYTTANTVSIAVLQGIMMSTVHLSAVQCHIKICSQTSSIHSEPHQII